MKFKPGDRVRLRDDAGLFIRTQYPNREYLIIKEYIEGSGDWYSYEDFSGGIYIIERHFQLVEKKKKLTLKDMIKE